MIPRNPIKSLLLACLLAATATATADTAKSVEAPVPLLWKVSDHDNAVYLLGSFHLLRPGDYPLSDDVDAAFDDAEQVMFELSPEEMDAGTLSMQMLQAATRTDGSTLEQDLDPDTWTRLQAWAEKNGLPLANFGSFESWFVGLTISIVEMTKQGLDPKLGLDNHFMERARLSGKPTAGLERGQEQIAVLDGMDATEQRQFVAESLEQAEKGSLETERLHQAWRRGDAEGLWTGMAADMKREYPRLYQRINVDRNDAWVPKIEQRLTESTSDDTLVVVGALHLLGEDGVVEKLRARGYTVERVCSACKAE
ncbi:TraB/GumN family protein [Pseudoxanthomonas putridarboris]|uniref:TraB/GumN family protein n=2 Tax=Pseudoxanthomonas putridarboris TaxID=752605 RepID=A0ABU9IZA2_9GAMM